MDRIEIKKQIHDCGKSCNKIINSFIKPDSNYIDYGKGSQWTSAIIDLDLSFDEYEKLQRKKYGGNIFRQARKSDYICHAFDGRTFRPNVVEINHSMKFRQRQKMKGHYNRSLKEAGGYPSKYYEPIAPECPYHWAIMFGCFDRIKGYMQGDVVTDEKLLAYIHLVRVGNICYYSMILGHGNYLNKGIMYKLHLYIIERLLTKKEYFKDLDYLMYAGWDSGTDGLKYWKKVCLFTQKQLYYDNN